MDDLDWGCSSGTAITVVDRGHKVITSANSTNPNKVLELQTAFVRLAEVTHTMASSISQSFFILSSSMTAVAQAVGAFQVRMYGSASFRGSVASWDSPYQEPRRSVLQRRREMVRRSAAEIKAEELLRSCLSREQDEQLSKSGSFDVAVGDRVYRIERGHAGNVVRLDGGRAVERFCIHPSGVPSADTMLAQKLLLESNERKFRSIANITPLI